MTILYPFQLDRDFKVGYAWSAELSRRLRAKHVLFATTAPAGNEPLADIYHALAEAQGFYIKNFQLLSHRLSPVKTRRNFVTGNFAETLLAYIRENPTITTVLQSDLLSNEAMKGIIQAGHKVIILPSADLSALVTTQDDRAQLFIRVMNQVALYNIPGSFFNTIAQDQGIFNAITRFFRK
ncbi:hypothetical protein [Chryseolinea lacunae]|uniref:Uncharacterized protein n=1 Tax=Chryseolinea lacunae TaxID=2801331 RepID=A0ABS1KWM5_9BACT|nr:hypothetical protein [Chryseolinea lacunae]MBL0742716.1 hypothetical protein [Chryseolinea lacunae]